MRFSELHLIRYGQFDGCQLEFPQAPSDLHVIYGPNEAGKSTTMAAITDLLFGFPHSAAYDFQFDKQLLRVGGSIEGAGASVTYRRKRGNVRTLLDAAEQPLDEGPLTALLQGQSRESFQRAFSLDHSRLRDGGRSILEAEDDIGQAIFAAGSGIVGVTRLVEALEGEAKAIWSDRASANRLYYAAQKAYEEARSRLREDQLRSTRWAELKKALETHERELATLRGQRNALQGKRHATERVRRILGPIAQRGHLLDQIASLGSVPDLPADAGAVLERAARQISESETTERFAREQAGEARSELAELVFDSSLLSRRSLVNELRAQQGAVEKALRDSPGLKAKAASESEQLSRLLREVGWAEASAREVQARLPGRPQVGELRALLEEYRGLEANFDAAAREVREQAEFGSNLQRQLDALPAPPVAPVLSAALQSIRGQGDIESAAQAAQARHKKARRTLDTGFAGLNPWRGTEQDLADLPLASEAETYQLGETLTEAQSVLASAQADIKGVHEDRERLELRRAQLLRHQHAISPEMLEGTRQARDTTWSEISAHLTGEIVLEAPIEAQQRFSRELREADDLADRRFDKAETSAALLRLDHELENLELSVAHHEARIADAAASLSAAHEAWNAATRLVAEAISPEGLRAWRANRLRVLELAEAEQVEANEATRLAQVLEAARAQLAGAFPSSVVETLPNASLATLLQAADKLELEDREIREERAALQVRLQAAEEAKLRAGTRRANADQSLEAWRGRWISSADAAGLASESSLPLVRARLDLLDEIRSLVDKILGYEKRLADITSDLSAFAAQVQSLAADIGLADVADPSGMLTAIEQQLDAIAALAERAGGFRTQLRNAEARETEAREAAEMARSSLAPLLAAANTSEPTELASVIEKSETTKRLKGEIEGLARSILELGDGLDLEALLDEASGVESAELAAHSDDLREELEGLTSEIERVAELRQAAYLQFMEADEHPGAAIAAADMAQARAEMEVQAEAYVRKRSEAALMRWTVERYRREKQAPLLKRASDIFSELTLGRYSGLGVDADDGRPRLTGLVADGASVVPVMGGMSEGTIDQLFLSLRLAAVEESVAAGVKLPFLADDLFINYDDDRSAAGFRVLAKLAEQTQVLFFTHHEHLADLARETLKPTNLSVRRLGELKMEAT